MVDELYYDVWVLSYKVSILLIPLFFIIHLLIKDIVTIIVLLKIELFLVIYFFTNILVFIIINKIGEKKRNVR